MALRTPPAWLQQGSHPAENDRLYMQAIFATTGIVGSTSLAVTAQASPNMTVNVAAGWAAIVGTTQANMGTYVAYNDATTVLTVTTAPTSNSRIDRVVATVNDAYYTGSSNNVTFQIVAGSPAASPTAPATPANSISLATILVGTNVTTITAGNITDTRVQTSSNLPSIATSFTSWTTATRPTGAFGKVGYNTTIGAAEVYNGTSWEPLSVDAYATSASRTSINTAPLAGQVSYLTSTDATNDTAHQLDFYNGSGWESVKTSQNNAIANGDFSKWTRGTSFVNPSFNTFTADNWRMINYDTQPSSATHSQQVFTPGSAPVAGYDGTYFYRSQITTLGTTTQYDWGQYINDVRTFANQTTVFSFWAKSASNQTNTIQFGRNIGTGGSGASGPTSSTNSFATTTSWQRFSITVTWPSLSGATIGTNSSIYIFFRQAMANGSTLDVWGAQWEIGSVASPFRPAGGNSALDTAIAGSAGFDGVLVATNSASNPSGSGTPAWAGFDVAGKNKIINGGFDFWQRGTSFTNPANSSYTVDRWINFFDGTGATFTISQQAFTPGTAPVAGYESAYFLRYAVTAAGSSNTYRFMDNRIEDVRTFAGQTVTYSFWAKADSARVISATPIQTFGSGGSGDVAATGSSFNMTTSWQRFSGTTSIPSIAGKTIGANNFLYLRLSLPAGVTETIDIWGIQLEAGSVATPFSRAGGTLQGELAACQRYYYRRTAGTYAYFGYGRANSTIAIEAAFKMPVTMRTTPTTVEASGTIAVYDGVTISNITLPANLGINSNQCNQDEMILVIAGTGYTQFRPYTIIANNNAASYIGVSAEL